MATKRIIVIDSEKSVKSPEKRCCIKDCTESYFTMGYCKSHYKYIIDPRILMNAVVDMNTNIVLKSPTPESEEPVKLRSVDRLLRAEKDLDELLDPRPHSKRGRKELADENKEDGRDGHHLLGKPVYDRAPRSPETEPRAPMRQLTDPQDRKPRRYNTTDEERIQMVKEWESGMTQKEVGILFDASPATVSRCIQWFREMYPSKKAQKEALK